MKRRSQNEMKSLMLKELKSNGQLRFGRVSNQVNSECCVMIDIEIDQEFKNKISYNETYGNSYEVKTYHLSEEELKEELNSYRKHYNYKI